MSQLVVLLVFQLFGELLDDRIHPMIRNSSSLRPLDENVRSYNVLEYVLTRKSGPQDLLLQLLQQLE